MTFFATAAAVQGVMLAGVVGVGIWFATVDPRRLAGADGRPNLLLLGLSALGAAVVLTAAVVMRTGTVFLIAFLAVGAVLVGAVRAGRAWLGSPDGDG